MAEHDTSPASLGDLQRDPSLATPREQLQAAVSVLLGRCSLRSRMVLGVDPWYWGQNPDEEWARLRLRALRLVLRWMAAGSGDEAKEAVVHVLLAELAPLLEVLDEECQQLRRPVGADPLRAVPVPGLRLVAEGSVVRAERFEGVVDALTGVEAGVLVGLLADDLFSVHGKASDVACGGVESPQVTSDGRPAMVQR